MPTPGATSASVNDKANGSFLDNGDGTFAQITATAAQNPNNQWATIGTTASVAAPGAGGTVAGNTAGTAGYYDIVLEYGYGGTAETATQDNFGVYLNSTLLNALPATVSQTNTLFPPVTYRRHLGAGDNIFIKAIGAASAGAVYKGFVGLTRTA